MAALVGLCAPDHRSWSGLDVLTNALGIDAVPLPDDLTPLERATALSAMRNQAWGHAAVAMVAALEVSLLRLRVTNHVMPPVASRSRRGAVVSRPPRRLNWIDAVFMAVSTTCSHAVGVTVGFGLHMLELLAHSAVWARRSHLVWSLELALVCMLVVGGHRATLPGLAYVAMVGVCMAVPRVKVMQWWKPMTLLLFVTSLLQYVALFSVHRGVLQRLREELGDSGDDLASDRTNWLAVTPSRWALVGDFIVLYVCAPHPSCLCVCLLVCFCFACMRTPVRLVVLIHVRLVFVVVVVFSSLPVLRWRCSLTSCGLLAPRTRTPTTTTTTEQTKKEKARNKAPAGGHQAHNSPQACHPCLGSLLPTSAALAAVGASPL